MARGAGTSARYWSQAPLPDQGDGDKNTIVSTVV